MPFPLDIRMGQKLPKDMPFLKTIGHRTTAVDITVARRAGSIVDSHLYS